jgi:hypothetical protein
MERYIMYGEMIFCNIRITYAADMFESKLSKHGFSDNPGEGEIGYVRGIQQNYLTNVSW